MHGQLFSGDARTLLIGKVNEMVLKVFQYRSRQELVTGEDFRRAMGRSVLLNVGDFKFSDRSICQFWSHTVLTRMCLYRHKARRGDCFRHFS